MANLDAFNKHLNNLKRMEKDMPDILMQFASAEGEVIVGEVKSLTPTITSLLKNSWHSKPEKTDNGIKVRITNNTEYASHVEYGHRIINKKGVTIGRASGRFMLRNGLTSYCVVVRDKRIQGFFNKKVREYLGD